MNIYKTTEGKAFQVLLRKRDARHGIVQKKFFGTEQEAYEFADQNEDKYYVEVLDLEYFEPG